MDALLAGALSATPGTLLGFVVIMILRGYLHSDREFQMLRDELANQRRETNDWKTAFLTIAQATAANTQSAEAMNRMLTTLEGQARSE